MKDKNYPLCLHIQPMDWITYKESLLAFYAVVQDLEKWFEKPMEEIESWTFDYKLLQTTTVQTQLNKKSISASVFKPDRYAISNTRLHNTIILFS